MDGVENVGVEDTPNADHIAVLLAEPTQQPIDGLGFWLKPFESLAINPTQVCVLHTHLRTTISWVRQEAALGPLKRSTEWPPWFNRRVARH